MGITSQGFGQEGYILDPSDLGGLPKPPPEAENFAVGVPYFLPFSTQYRDSWEIFRDDPVSIRQLIAMRRQDGQARALFRLLTMPVLAALKNADVIPVDGQVGGSAEAQFCKDLLFAPAPAGGMTQSVMKFMQQMVLALFNGFSAWEMIYWVPRKGPNKGKITLRKIDWRPSETLTFLLDGQGEFAGFRQLTFFQGRTIDVKIPKETALYYACNEAERPFYGVSMFESAFFHYDKKCVSGGMKVSLLDGTEVEIRELAERSARGEDIWLYSCRDGKVVPGKVSHVWPSGRKPVVGVRLDNGETVRCTPDHRFMLRDGSWREAGDLKPGDSLMPLYRRARKLADGALDYEQVQHPGSGKWEWTHRMVSRELGFAAGRGHVIHHGFGGLRHRNNDPRNLTRMTGEDHLRLHSGLMRKRWQDPAWRERMTSPEQFAKKGAGIRRSWAEASPARRAERAAIAAGNASVLHRTDVTVDAIAEQVAAGVVKRLDVAAALGTNEVIVLQRIKVAGHKSWREFVRGLGGSPLTAGWGRSRRFSLEDLEAAYRAAAGEDGLVGIEEFAAALGCSTGQVYRALKYEGYQSFTTWRAEVSGERRNHKVVSVEDAGTEEVYDLEVPGLENFALSAGVFVHNCKLYYIAHLAAQRAATGLRVGTMKPNPNAADKSSFTRALANLGLAQYIVLPDADWTVTSIKEEGNFDFLGLINHHNSQMSKSVLAAWFDEQQGGGQGDSALVDFGNQDDATWLMMLDGLLEEMAEIIESKIFPRFVDWNFGTGLYPQFKWGELTAEQKAAIQDTFDKLAAAGQGANVTPEFMLELEKRMATELGLDIDYDKIEKEREKQQNLMQKQASAQMQQGPPPQAGSIGAQPPPQFQRGGSSGSRQSSYSPPVPGPNPHPGPGGPYGD